MYRKKHLAASENRPLPKKKVSLLLVSLVLIAAIAVGSTVAFIATSTESITNTFNPANVTIDIDEKFESGVKTDVQVKNTGNTDAFIRAKIVVTWKDTNGNVSATKPVLGEDKDYTMTLNTTDWFLGSDGFYYCKTSVAPDAPNNLTPVLIKECKKVDGVTPPEDYDLSVEIIASGIQSTPASAVEEAWKVVSVSNDGTLTKKS